MGENSKIIVVANQKGGVGKSTLCMALANYLALELKFNVGGIIDTDHQRSIARRREADTKRYEGTSNAPAYQVTTFSLDNYNQLPNLIDRLRENDSFYIFDTPGRLDHNGIRVLLTLADYVLVPFNYYELSLVSTAQFVMFWNNHMDDLHKKGLNASVKKLIFVPMQIDKRIGTKKELALWDKLREHYRKVGPIAPQITFFADGTRIDTYQLNKEQLSKVDESFQFIVNEIFTSNTDDDAQ